MRPAEPDRQRRSDLFARIDGELWIYRMENLTNPSDTQFHFNVQMADDVHSVPPLPPSEPIADTAHRTASVESSPENVNQTQSESEALRQSLIKSITEFERSFRRNFPVLWISTFLGPAVISGVVLTLIGLIGGWGLASKFIYHAAITFFVFGRFVILGGYEGQGEGVLHSISLAPSQLFLMLTFMDFMVALFVTFHMGILFRVPWAGPKIAGLVSDGKFLMDHHPWLKRVTFVGLVTFVIFPTSTTGSIGGSIFGRLLGLGRFFTVTGVLLGSILGNGIMYFFAKEINKYFGADTLWLKLAGILILVAGVFLVEWRFRKLKQQYLAGVGRDNGEN